MTIRSEEAFLKGLWDWAILDGCFGQTRIKPTDVDGLIERHGCFLFLEAKADGKEVSQGQNITFRQLSRQPRTFVIAFNGNREERTISRIVLYRNGQEIEQENPGVETLRSLVARWYAWADKQQ